MLIIFEKYILLHVFKQCSVVTAGMYMRVQNIVIITLGRLYIYIYLDVLIALDD